MVQFFFFQLTDLRAIFEFCVCALKELTPTLTVPILPERHNLVLRLCTLAESILSWAFININLPKKLVSILISSLMIIKRRRSRQATK